MCRLLYIIGVITNQILLYLRKIRFSLQCERVTDEETEAQES